MFNAFPTVTQAMFDAAVKPTPAMLEHAKVLFNAAPKITPAMAAMAEQAKRLADAVPKHVEIFAQGKRI